MAKRLFYCTDHIYKIGDVIKPGHWKNYVLAQPATNINVSIEMTLEFARKSVAPNSISRLECIFAFIHSSDAENFALNGKKIYELKLCNRETQVSFHNYKIFSYLLGQLDIKPANLLQEKQLFIDYWNKKSQTNNSQGQQIAYVEEAHIQGDVEVIEIY